MVYAWVTTVMCGDEFVRGAITLASSLRAQHTKYDIICMVTRDVSNSAICELRKVFDAVRIVECIASIDQQQRYNQKRHTDRFKRNILTRLRCLGFTEYTKICLVDADVVFQANADDLFELCAPAGTFEHPWMDSNQQHYFEYGELSHGSVRSQKKIKSICHTKRGGFAAWGSLLLLTPSQQTLSKIIALSVSFKVQSSCLSRDDELIIIEAHPPETFWTHISSRYHAVTWKKHINQLEQPIIGVHFRGKPKPWQMAEADCWLDQQLFWDTFHMAVEKYNITL